MKNFKMLLMATLLVAAVFAKPEISAGQITPITCRAMDQTGSIKTYDTTINTDTTYMIPYGNGGVLPITTYSDVVCSWTNTNLSGSTGGSVIFQGSQTGAFLRTAKGDWETLINDKAGSLINDTVTVSGTTSGTFIIANCKYKNIRGRYISSGTQTSTMRMTCYIKPH